jgi:hypothetical protein
VADSRDPFHEACRALLERHRGPLFVPMLVISEAAYLLERDLGTGAEIALLGDILDGQLTTICVEPSDWARTIDLVWTYRDMHLGTVDASVVATAERLRVRQIATLDHRQFSVVRPAHVEAFELLP